MTECNSNAARKNNVFFYNMVLLLLLIHCILKYIFAQINFNGWWHFFSFPIMVTVIYKENKTIELKQCTTSSISHQWYLIFWRCGMCFWCCECISFNNLKNAEVKCVYLYRTYMRAQNPLLDDKTKDVRMCLGV